MFLFIPITHLLGNVTAYNLWVIFTFVFSGFGMYLLVDYLIGDKKIAFCPFHFGAALGHLHTFSICFLPFFVLYLHKMIKTPSLKNTVIAAIFFAVNALTSWTIGVMATLFLIINLLLTVVNFNRIKEYMRIYLYIMLFSIISLILMSPGLYYILKNIFGGYYTSLSQIIANIQQIYWDLFSHHPFHRSLEILLNQYMQDLHQISLKPIHTLDTQY